MNHLCRRCAPVVIVVVVVVTVVVIVAGDEREVVFKILVMLCMSVSVMVAYISV